MSKLRISSLPLAVVLVLATSFVARAQQDGKNTNSPYTLYGIGNMNIMGTAENKSMAGAGVSLKSAVSVNGLNPAGLSAAPEKSFLFSVSMQGNNDYISSATSNSSSNTFNLNDLSLQVPIAKNLGFGIMMNSYTSVGYDMSIQGTDEDLTTTIGPYNYYYDGSGGITQLKAGLGWEPFRGLSIGAAALFYHSSIYRNTSLVFNSYFQSNNEYRTVTTNNTYSFTKANVEAGIIYSVFLPNKRSVSFGGTYQPEVTITQDDSRLINTYSSLLQDSVSYSYTESTVVLPSKITAGVSYSSSKLTIAADYIYQDFTDAFEINSTGANISLTTYQDFRLGFSYTPNSEDIRKALNRWTYRAGVRYGNSYLAVDGNEIKDYSLSFGAGIPLQRGGYTQLNVGFDLGQRGSVSATDFKETYFNFTLGVNFFSINEWFVRYKYK
ncbi:MAG: hypothetical protein R3Y04_02715 [Rikenellaceae bacterium]